MKNLTLKAILALALSFSSMSAQNSGFFVGLQGGIALNSSSGQVATQNAFAMQDNVVFNLIYGARLGYIASFNEFNGLRIYGDFSAGWFNAFGQDYYNMSGGAGLDYLASFSEHFGMFFGLGYNYNFGKLMDAIGSRANPHNPYANLGFAWNVSIVRIELGAKVPFLNFFNAEAILIDPNDATNVISAKQTIRTHAQIYLNLDFVF
ncbi:hypothetical protein DCO58_00945 [Helicobacter saguini]|uniref:Outer membrane protein n=1 Tax=Helicobacter saguini TaxID=1548018 RepID=A0A347VR40_9HELI|nr:hypothetical protein [Helicobacter saguini]MWV63044.1 hypothetical protein [Helicobacter saguini]MWV66287.1 hypothetical protein [Helicobacter saguini]MWV68639.1 hypothetical protein [Helicobacter saguini]MWV71810.1 hypothetical protein [Helicobacter saguini]TLD95836.1 hypothetical protein LS64_000240 [Helicobacter saguini]